MENGYTLRWPGIRWAIRHAAASPVERFALAEAQRLVQRQVPYLVRVEPAAEDLSGHADHLLLLGTPVTPRVRELCERWQLSVPEAPGSYLLACRPSPWNPDRTVLLAAGRDAAGVLHGVEDLAARVVGIGAANSQAWGSQRALDGVAPFARTEIPRIARRGIWSWGYVVYDHRRFLDAMARLRMNALTLWNDVPPVNAAEIVTHAHDRGIEVVWGFHWGWGIRDLDLANPDHVAWVRRTVLDTYERQYAGIPHDGIYFQTATEVRDTLIGGVPIARLARNLVNDVGRALLERHPGLRIQFGLHATSILDHCGELEELDPRISIVWEDAGVIPWSYVPVSELSGAPLGTVDATAAYGRRIAALRGRAELAMVAKGFTALRWDTEFEHHGPFLLGERSPGWIHRRLAERQPIWDRADDLWMANWPHASRFFREALAEGPRSTDVRALVEDGLLEERIAPSIALFANLLWDPLTDGRDLPALAHSPWYAEASAVAASP
ncbi:MAG: hypothetical protein NTU62_16060 [Spirochaetes bacterium]|nr:hypothetical protein [Spirochaetota bacterium]